MSINMKQLKCVSKFLHNMQRENESVENREDSVSFANVLRMQSPALLVSLPGFSLSSVSLIVAVTVTASS